MQTARNDGCNMISGPGRRYQSEDNDFAHHRLWSQAYSRVGSGNGAFLFRSVQGVKCLHTTGRRGSTWVRWWRWRKQWPPSIPCLSEMRLCHILGPDDLVIMHCCISCMWIWKSWFKRWGGLLLIGLRLDIWLDLRSRMLVEQGIARWQIINQKWIIEMLEM